MKLEFSRQIKKKTTQISNFVKKRPVETELFPADIRTDTTKLIVAFPNFVNSPANLTSFFSFVSLTVEVYKSQRFLYVPPGLTLKTTVYLCVLYGTQNKQRLFPYTALIDWLS